MALSTELETVTDSNHTYDDATKPDTRVELGITRYTAADSACNLRSAVSDEVQISLHIHGCAHGTHALDKGPCLGPR